MQKRWLVVGSVSLLSLVGSLLVACHPSLGRFDALVNQGVLPLSVDNPYNGSNLLLSTEAEKSLVLQSFLMNRGVPLAVQLSRATAGATEMALFYPQLDEFFVATLTEEGDVREWVVRGPYQTDRRTFRELRTLLTTPYGTPVLLIDGEEVSFPGVAALNATPTPTPSPTPQKSKRTPKVKPTAQPTIAPTPVGAPPTATPLPVIDPLIGKRISEDLIAIIRSEGWAERTLQGDILHSVRNGDTLDAIAAWYTGSTGNSPTLRMKNSLAPEGEPVLGQKILIPRNIAVQFKPLP